MNKILLLILVLLVIGIFSFERSGSVMANKHFDNGEVSFDYPSGWNLTNGTGTVVASMADTNGLNVTIKKHPVPDAYNLNKHMQLSGEGNVDKNFQLISNNNITVNGMNGYELNYKLNGKDGEKQRKEIWFEKNNLFYSVEFTTSGNMAKKSELAVNSVSGNSITQTLVKSLNINTTASNPISYTGWGEVTMPSGKKWTLTTVSCDVNNAVYHIDASYWPGENGEFALMGHHTTHHAPFAGLESIKVGELVVVKDYVTGKKYTYQITSNGNDIRWGQEGDHIQYKRTANPELLLITCWPPGYSRGAYIVHSKLISVELLN